MSKPVSGRVLAKVTPVDDGASNSNSGRDEGDCGCFPAVHAATPKRTAVRVDRLWRLRCRSELPLGQASRTEG